MIISIYCCIFAKKINAMNELFEISKMPKNYLLEVTGDYMQVKNSISKIIDATGYKHDFIARKLDMPISTYYFKRRTKTFAENEVMKIIEMLEDEKYNAEEWEIIQSRKDEETVSSAEFKKYLTATMR